MNNWAIYKIKVIFSSLIKTNCLLINVVPLLSSFLYAAKLKKNAFQPIPV